MAIVERGARGGTLGTGPRVNQRAQPIEAAEVTLLRHRDVECGNRCAVDIGAVTLKVEMRRAKQRHHRPAREVRRHGFENDVDRRCVRLRGKRQGVERFVRNAGARKHLASEIEVRQRPRHDEADAIERRFHAAPAIGLDTSRDAFELVLAIAVGEHGAVTGIGHDQDGGRGGRAFLRLGRLNLDKRQLQPIEIPRIERVPGRDDVDRLETGDGREQRHIGRPVAVRIERPIADRDDDMPNRFGTRDGRQVDARAMLVDRAAVV